MEMEFSKLEKVVGTFIIGVALLMMSTLVIIGRGKDWFEKYIPYYTTFNESYNLQKNASVKLFKADIGKVQDITLTQNRVRVKLLILDRYASRIRQDAITVVESPTFIGSEYISIIPGSSDAPLIEPEGEIPSKEKRSISDIMSEFEVEKTAKMVVQTIQDLSEISKMLGDPDGPLLSALENVEQITADLKSGKGLIGALMTSETLMREMSNRLDQMDAILNTVQTAVNKTPETMDLVNANLATFQDTGQSVQQRVKEAKTILEDIRVGAANLKTITDNIKSGSTHVPRIATTFRDGIQEIREGVEQINRVVKSLQSNVFIRSNLPDEPAPGHTDAMTEGF